MMVIATLCKIRSSFMPRSVRSDLETTTDVKKRMSSFFSLRQLVQEPADVQFLREIIREGNIETDPEKGPAFPDFRPDIHPFKCTMCPSDEASYCLFNTAGEKRAHFSSEWHKFNTTMSHKGHLELLTPSEYGSLSEEARELLLDEPPVDIPADFAPMDEEAPSIDRESLTVFSLRRTPGKQYQIYTEILNPKELKKDVVVSAPRDLLFQLLTVPASWLIILLTSGRFYYGIFDNTTGKCTKHGALTTYVGRRKQGGSQLIRDRKAPVARSAGSQLRRENERKWIISIETVLNSLGKEGLLNGCSLIFQACSVYYQTMLFKLLENREKIRRIPFTTYTPTFLELQRCYRKLSVLE